MHEEIKQDHPDRFGKMSIREVKVSYLSLAEHLFGKCEQGCIVIGARRKPVGVFGRPCSLGSGKLADNLPKSLDFVAGQLQR
jgi:hypothetical protein